MFVIYHSSDAFASVTGTSMLSLFENNQDADSIHVLYIERGLSDENKKKLQMIVDQYHREIEFMPMPNWSEKLNVQLKSSKKTWLGFGYNRLFLTSILPESIERVLYLDSDTIIEDSLENLWNLDFEDCYLAGVDDCLSKKYRKLVNIGEDGTYCNAGMLLFNLKKWREDKVMEKAIQMICENNGYFPFNEQTILNSLFSGKIKVLPQKYNVNSLVYLFSYEELMKLRMPYHFSYDKNEYDEARQHPVISHFTGNFYVQRRPWIENSDHPHKDFYMRYYENSPWKDVPLIKEQKKNKYNGTTIAQSLPRSLAVRAVSILYNYLRPISMSIKLRKARQ